MGGRIPAPEDRKHDTRANAYPENTSYQDTGCHLHPACLTCPLPVCAIESREQRQISTIERNEQIVRMLQAGAPVAEIAIVLDMTRQAVYAVLKRSGHFVRGKQTNPYRKETAG